MGVLPGETSNPWVGIAKHSLLVLALLVQSRVIEFHR